LLINQLHETEARWFAVYTRYKREKVVLKRLAEQGREIYLPLQKVTRYYTRKIVHTELPLISCYIFARVIKKEYVPILEDPDVLFFVKQRADLLAIPEREINILRAVTGEGVPVEVSKMEDLPREGDEVEIIQGRLFGMKGFLLETRNRKIVVIELETLGMALQLQLPLEHVRKTGKRKAHGDNAEGKAKNRFNLMGK
jgi:transcription antitermination factor NusG